MITQCNSTLENQELTETPIWHGATIHDIGKYVGAIFALIAVILSFILIYLHATHYLKPWEQKHIIRILFMVPIYAVVSWLSYVYYTHSVYFEVLRDCYEAFAIAAFFTLLCNYIVDDLHEQKNYFRTIQPKPWVWPLSWLQSCCGGKKGIFRTPRSGLTWFNVVWVCVFQFCFVDVFMTIVAVITQAFGRYCLESYNPIFSHPWVSVIDAIAVTIAMYGIIQFYYQIHKDITQHSPLLKVAAIKLVIFLSFWQTWVISILTSLGAIKPSAHFQTPDIKVGLPSFLLCVEMAFFAIFHFWAFSWKDYTTSSKVYQQEMTAGDQSPPHYQGGFLGLKAIADACNPWDIIKAVARSGRWLFVGHKKRMLDPSYAVSRTDTDDMMRSDTNAYSNTKLNPMNGPTAYTGVAGQKPGSRGNPPTYAVEEDRQPLVYDQGHNPFSDSVGREHSPYSLSGVEPRDTAGDIGVANSYGEGEDWNRGRSNYPAPAIHIRAPSAQEMGVTAPYPDEHSRERQQMPYFEPPPGAPDGRR